MPFYVDPSWASIPGRENKSTCTLIAFCSYDWFKKYEQKTVKKRGDEYEGLKKTFGHKMIEQESNRFKYAFLNICDILVPGIK